MKKKQMILWYLLNEKGIFPSSEMKCPKSWRFSLIVGWGESGKAILNETLVIGVARNLCWGAENRGAEGSEIETPKA